MKDMAYILKKGVEYGTRKGRIVWGRTVKELLPDIDGSGNPFYRKTVKRHRLSVENSVTEIHRCFLEYFFCEESGWMLNNVFMTSVQESSILDMKSLIEEKDYYISLLETELSSCYKDEEISLLSLMLRWLKNGGCGSEDADTHSNVYGVFDFANLFELMVGDYYGNQLTETDEGIGFNSKSL